MVKQEQEKWEEGGMTVVRDSQDQTGPAVGV